MNVTTTIDVDEGSCLVKADCQADNRSAQVNFLCAGRGGGQCAAMSGGGVTTVQAQSSADVMASVDALSLAMNAAGDTVTCTHRNVVSNVTASAPVDCGASTGTAAKAHCEYDG